MPLFYNISPDPQVLDWNVPAIMPGDAVDVPADEAAGLSPTIWSETPPVKPVVVSAPEKNASNQSGGSIPRRDKPVTTPESETPADTETPAPEEAK